MLNHVHVSDVVVASVKKAVEVRICSGDAHFTLFSRLVVSATSFRDCPACGENANCCTWRHISIRRGAARGV
jgi:hypothetical protein